jgi:hypothetical protein
MSESRPVDAVAGALLGVGLVAAVIELFYRPFGVGPVGFLSVLIASGISARHRRLGAAAVGIVVLCFMIGASIAIWDSRALY